MCPFAVRKRTKAVQLSTAAPCADQAGEWVRQIVLDLRPMRGIKGALDDICDETAAIARRLTGEDDADGISFWKLKKLWNPSLRRHGLAWKADEHHWLR